jgi:hypothetical protein
MFVAPSSISGQGQIHLKETLLWQKVRSWIAQATNSHLNL